MYFLDEESGMDYQIKSIDKKMNMVQFALDFKEEVQGAPVGHKQIT